MAPKHSSFVLVPAGLTAGWDWNTALTINQDASAVALIRGGMTWHATDYADNTTWRAVGQDATGSHQPEGPQWSTGVEDPCVRPPSPHASVAAAAPHNPGFQAIILPGYPRVCALSTRTSATVWKPRLWGAAAATLAWLAPPLPPAAPRPPSRLCAHMHTQHTHAHKRTHTSARTRTQAHTCRTSAHVSSCRIAAAPRVLSPSACCVLRPPRVLSPSAVVLLSCCAAPLSQVHLEGCARRVPRAGARLLAFLWRTCLRAPRARTALAEKNSLRTKTMGVSGLGVSGGQALSSAKCQQIRKSTRAFCANSAKNEVCPKAQAVHFLSPVPFLSLCAELFSALSYPDGLFS